MKSEGFARDIQLKGPEAKPEFSSPVEDADKRIFAYAYVNDFVGGRNRVSLQVYNLSDKTIATEKLFRDLVIVAKDGKRYDRSENENMWNRENLRPGENASFNFVFPGIHISKNDISMIVCSFGLGDTLIVLLPYQGQEATPPASPALGSPEKKSVSPPDKTVNPSALTAANAEKKECCAAVMKTAQSLFHNMANIFAGHDSPPETKPSPPPPAAPKIISEKPAPKPAQKPSEETLPGFGKILHVDTGYGFVVLSTGTENGINKGAILDVVRDGKRIGKVKVVKPREQVSGAVILKEWQSRNEIRVGDQVRIV